MPQDQTPQNRAFVRHLASVLYFRKAQNPTVIRIMLQERTLRCQLKVCSKGLKRSRYGSLHAYLPIDLAVETSQPQLIAYKDTEFPTNIKYPQDLPSNRDAQLNNFATAQLSTSPSLACRSVAPSARAAARAPLAPSRRAIRCIFFRAAARKKDAASIPHAARAFADF